MISYMDGLATDVIYVQDTFLEIIYSALVIISNFSDGIVKFY